VIATAGTVFALAGLVSIGAAALLVSRLERLGARLGLTEALLGLLAALAADGPEITAATTALLRGQRSVGVGVVVGSNVFNLAALLGLGALVAGRIRLHRDVVLLEGTVACWLAGITVLVATGAAGPGTGLALALPVLVAYVIVAALPPTARDRLPLPGRWRRWLSTAVADEERELAPQRPTPTTGRRDGAVAGLALVTVVGASVVMEHVAVTIGAHYAIAGVIIGGVVLAAVTSLPNAVAAIYLARRGRGTATLSTALNSNSLNVVFGLLAPAVLVGLGIPSGGSTLIAVCYLGLTGFVLVACYAGRGLGRRAGAAIVAGYVAFVAVLLAGA